MAISHPLLSVGGILLPHQIGIDLRQTYEPVQAVAERRKRNGTLRTMIRWTGKLRTTISFSGWSPNPFSGLARGVDYSIKCAMPRAVAGVGAGTIITLPVARRTDATPFAVAMIGLDEIETPVSIVTSTATVTAVAGALSYLVYYFPEFTGRLVEVREEADRGRAEFPTSVTFEQV